MASSARIEELRKKFDENPRRYFAPLANEYRKAGDLEQAIFICQEYLPQQPGHMSGHIVYGQALFELARFDEARAVFETALSLDPENLIALRHLGDIARQADDLRGARAWYQRVLEADPRNEEIAQLMLTVLTTPHDSQPAVEPAVEPAVAVESTPIVEAEPEPSFPVEKSEDVSGLAIGPELSQLAERQPQAEPEPTPAFVEATSGAIPEDELLDLDDFSIGDMPMSSISTPAESAPAESFVEAPTAFASMPGLLESALPDVHAPNSEAPEAEFTAEPELAVTAEMEIERSGDSVVFEADPFAIAIPEVADVATSVEAPVDIPVEARIEETTPPEEFATDIKLGLEGGEEDAPSSVSEALDGLQSFSEPAYGTTLTEAAPVLEVESFFSPPADEPESVEAVASAEPIADEPSSWEAGIVDTTVADEPFVEAPVLGSPVFEVPSTPPLDETAVPTEEFVTETMAELYLQQGHLDSALDIYRKLSEQHPGDTHLRDCVAAVSEAIEAAANAPVAETAAPFDEAAAFGDASAFDESEDDLTEALIAGPTIREFLAGIFQARSYDASSVAEERAPTPVATATVDEVSDIPDFATPSFGEFAVASDESLYDEPSYETPAFGGTPEFGATPAFSTTPAFGVDSLDEPLGGEVTAFEQSVAEQAVVEQSIVEELVPEAPAIPAIEETLDVAAAAAPSFEESPYEAQTLEIDLGAHGFESTAEEDVVASVDDLSIDEDLSSLDEPTAPPPVTRPTPASSQTVSGSIDALFSGADASSTDSTAASTLAQAFASEVSETPPLQGMPAHRAADELSLDHVFKSNPAPRPEADGEGFSFDQFFAEDMNDSAAKPSEPTSAAAQRGSDDIAQFNNWLNGLKKT